MYLLEHEGKDLFREFGIDIPLGFLVNEGDKLALVNLPEEVVVKVQIPFGKRGKAGGVKICSKIYLQNVVKEFFLKRKFAGFNVKKLLIEEKIKIKREMYLSVVIDRVKKSLVILFSAEGGVDIEELAEKMPEKIVKVYFNHDEMPNIPGVPYEVNEIAHKLVRLAEQKDAILAEINPLVLTEDDKFIAVDAKVTIDDNSLFRHPEFEKEHQVEWSEIEHKAHKAGLEYVELEGNIGVIGNGAGLTMASLDILIHFGGKPANFLDIGGGADMEKMKQALEICAMKESLKVIFINIFGGITHCDQIASGIVAFKKEYSFDLPILIRLIGTNELEGQKMLEGAGIKVKDSMKAAAEEAVKCSFNLSKICPY